MTRSVVDQSFHTSIHVTCVPRPLLAADHLQSVIHITTLNPPKSVGSLKQVSEYCLHYSREVYLPYTVPSDQISFRNSQQTKRASPLTQAKCQSNSRPDWLNDWHRASPSCKRRGSGYYHYAERRGRICSRGTWDEPSSNLGLNTLQHPYPPHSSQLNLGGFCDITP